MEEEIVIKIDEIINKIVSDVTGTYLYFDKSVFDEWVNELKGMVGE